MPAVLYFLSLVLVFSDGSETWIGFGSDSAWSSEGFEPSVERNVDHRDGTSVEILYVFLSRQPLECPTLFSSWTSRRPRGKQREKSH